MPYFSYFRWGNVCFGGEEEKCYLITSTTLITTLAKSFVPLLELRVTCFNTGFPKDLILLMWWGDGGKDIPTGPGVV